MKRTIILLVFVVLATFATSIIVGPAPERSALTLSETSPQTNMSKEQLVKESRGAGLLIERSQVERSNVLPQIRPGVAYADPFHCEFDCDDMQHNWFGLESAFALFHVTPKFWTTPTAAPAGTATATPRSLVWQEHAANKFAPVSVFVSWGGTVFNMEIASDGTTAGSGISNDVMFFHFNVLGCDGFNDSTLRIFDGGAPCISQIDYDIDWKKVVGGHNWDWIYFWVRDPDFVAMKGVDQSECSTDQWPYEYVNTGPKYYICQTFSQIHQNAHGYFSSGVEVNYDVLYQVGVPQTPTSGATTTPPSPVTPTPCSGLGC